MEKNSTKRTLWQKLKRLQFLSKGMTLAEFQERGDDKLQIEDSYIKKFYEAFFTFQYKHTYTYC